jgi:lysozyme
VRGVDVSSHQGEIDWEILAGHNIHFAYIKATEGSTFVDQKFESNFKAALNTRLRIGAYHFFSYGSGGRTQAENFISVVTPHSGMLPPAVDVEFYGGYADNPPDKNVIQAELAILLCVLENYYGIKPIIYVTQTSYRLYIDKMFDDYDIWIRNVYTSPTIASGKNWVFWQYNDKDRLDGYVGKEKYIDMNVFCGSQSDFNNYAK